MFDCKMEVPKLTIILLCCLHYSLASYHSHTIPVEGYDTELQNLGQHVEFPETPVKVIKITKTIAVKIPVPYPVKVKERVPYPVHISKPYPVPVPHIIKVPHAVPPAHGHEAVDANQNDVHNSRDGGDQGSSYQVQEGDSYSGGGGHNQQGESFSEQYHPNEGYSSGSSYDAPIHSFNGNGNFGGHDSDASYDTRSYDQAIQEYLQKRNSGAGAAHGGDSGGYHYR